MDDKTERINKTFSAHVKAEAGERAVTAIISTSAVDREGDVLVPQGCYTKNYEKNPIVCYAHDAYYAPPVGKCVAIKRDDTTITAKLVFAERPKTHPENLEWFPDTLLSLYQQGVMNAFSVGLSPIEQRAATTRDQNKFGEGCQRVVSKWEMYEFSCVPVGMNQEAVSVAVSKGLITAEQAEKMFKGDPEGDAIEWHAPEIEAKAIEPIEPEPVVEEPIVEKHVVATVDLAEPVEVKHVHRVLIQKTQPVKAQTRKLVMIEMAKREGRLYMPEES